MVGHSLGGGIAMQVLYQYPQLVQRLVLVDSGGLGRDVSIALRAVTLPGAEARAAFVSTARSVLDVGGQRVDARDRFYLATRIPTLLVWGGQDAVIPVAHAHAALAAMPAGRLAVFERSGHFPQCDEPDRFARAVGEFIADADGCVDGAEAWRQALLEHSGRS